MSAQCVSGALVAAWIGIVVSNLLPHTDGLKVHAKKCRHSWARRSVMLQAVNLIDDSPDLLLVILNRTHNAHRRIESVDVGDLGRKRGRQHPSPTDRSPDHRQDACPPTQYGRPRPLPLQRWCWFAARSE